MDDQAKTAQPRLAFKNGLGFRWIAAAWVVFSLLSASGCAWLDTQQRQLIYRPTTGDAADFTGLRAGDERYFVDVLPASDHTNGHGDETRDTVQRVEMWWLPHADKRAPTLLYFHGTFQNLSQNLHKMEALRAAGFAVLAVEYRGWGLSTPITPSEHSILQDAAAAWSELERRERRAGRRVIYGHSMGGGVAVDVASRLRAQADYAALILESAFTSFDGVANEAGFFARLLASLNHEHFASIEKITQVHAPLLMIHGSADDTIPVRLGQQLFAAANPPKLWVLIDGGGHSDLHQIGDAQYQMTLRSFRNLYVAGP